MTSLTVTSLSASVLPRPSMSLRTPIFPQILRFPHASQQLVWCMYFTLASVNRRDMGMPLHPHSQV
ncbi:hypothetical protein ARMGADRAFT_1012799, partial [Armillaria gallica]